MTTVIDAKKKFRTKKIKDKIDYTVHDVLGAEAFIMEEEYKIIDNKQEALKLQADGWNVEEVTMYVCMKL